MKQNVCSACPAPASAPRREEPPVCWPVYLRSLPNIPRHKLAYSPLLLQKQAGDLQAAFQAAPQFAKVPVRQLFRERRGNLRVIFLTDSDYYARQAAVYLATLSRLEQHAGQSKATEENDDWAIFEGILDGETEAKNPLQDGLAVVAPLLLDPDLQKQKNEGPVAMIMNGEEKAFRLLNLDTSAVLLAAPSGPVLSEKVMEQIADLGERSPDSPLDVFVALRPEQVDLEYIEELRFSFGFHVCRVGRPDQDYFRRFLTHAAGELMCTLREDIDLDQVIAQTRRYRGAAFDETDLEKLVVWAVQRQATPPLGTQDLLFAPFQDKKTAWKELGELVGLEAVKDALRRRLAAAALESRRRQRGEESQPMYRNLAFSGPPGTGKSVTARLAARILREEGCGTGRFVEAGREQLIGTYMGHTSPMVAKLFQQAKGGVLFIDEAGALLDGARGQDSYAVEAVNALVRHMELEPETMVIFATYPGEMERLLASNPGLASRVTQVLDFPGYDDGALWEIFGTFARKDGRVLPDGAEEVCRSFFAVLRRRQGESFGNGREARRLYQGAVEELALAVLEEGREETLTLGDLERAARRLLDQPGGSKERKIGF